MLGTYLCRFLGHKVDRRRVWNDGIDFRTACARCKTPLLCDHIAWREFDAERDNEPGRLTERPHD